jgi:hypothetical protein
VADAAMKIGKKLYRDPKKEIFNGMLKRINYYPNDSASHTERIMVASKK